MNNPFSLSFGKEPPLYISRIFHTNMILESFTADNPVHQVYMLTGIRGSGKTVLLTEVAKQLRRKEDWVVVDLNPERDMLQALAAKLYSNDELYSIFENAHINLSLFGIGLEMENTPPISDIEVAISRLLGKLKEHGKRVLITVDEVTGNPYVKVFAASFQMLMRQDLPVFLLMTGLYENVDDLQNEKSLTFLLRAPKVRMEPLSLGAIADRYQRSIGVEAVTAQRMARLTKGYAYAFQVLGYLSWGQFAGKGRELSGQLLTESGHSLADDDRSSRAHLQSSIIDSVLSEYRQNLEEYVYRKIWSGLSAKDRLVVRAIAEAPSHAVADIRKVLKMSTNEFNPYRSRLIRKEVIDGSVYGKITFTLPFFDQFVLSCGMYEE